MQVSAEISYPTSSTERVFALTVAEDFREAVCVATHALDYRVEVTQGDDGLAHVRVERTLPADVPEAVKRFIGATITIVQTEDWGRPGEDGRRVADLTIQISGQPASMTGSILLEPAARGSVQRIRGDLTVSVPFLGKRMEPEVAKAIVAAAAKEQETGRTWLERSP